jgi:alginate O-acetyltransferase complex protein AlgI
VLFTEPTFLFLFLPLLLALYFATSGREHASWGNGLLLVASIVFYAKGGGPFTYLVLAAIAFNYWMAIAVDRVHATPAAKRRLLVAVAVNLLVLGVFKYANFFADNVNTLFLLLGVHPLVVPRVLLPIGISFFTFHAISYVVDVHRRDATAQKSPVHAALYLVLFPQLIAGPIIRYRDIADQLACRIVTLDDFAYGVRRFIVGLAKKVLVANVVAGPADRIFGMPFRELSAGHAWLGLVCYTLQIYFDFSGYSDMAIGLGRMFGFRFPENFRWPYISQSVQEFWRRWHISLSTWFRDYLYVPLGGNRVSPLRRYRNLVTVFFLSGLWHGASWMAEFLAVTRERSDTVEFRRASAAKSAARLKPRATLMKPRATHRQQVRGRERCSARLSAERRGARRGGYRTVGYLIPSCSRYVLYLVGS